MQNREREIGRDRKVEREKEREKRKRKKKIESRKERRMEKSEKEISDMAITQAILQNCTYLHFELQLQKCYTYIPK